MELTHTLAGTARGWWEGGRHGGRAVEIMTDKRQRVHLHLHGGSQRESAERARISSQTIRHLEENRQLRINESPHGRHHITVGVFSPLLRRPGTEFIIHQPATAKIESFVVRVIARTSSTTICERLPNDVFMIHQVHANCCHHYVGVVCRRYITIKSSNCEQLATARRLRSIKRKRSSAIVCICLLLVVHCRLTQRQYVVCAV